MDTKRFDMGEIDIAVVSGLRQFCYSHALKQALSELEIKPERHDVRRFCIGQAAKAPHYYKCNLSMDCTDDPCCGNRH